MVESRLAEMTQLGIPVPAGFTITTDACRAAMRGAVPEELDAEVGDGVAAGWSGELSSIGGSVSTRTAGVGPTGAPAAKERASPVVTSAVGIPTGADSVVIGPCSIHDPAAAIEYAERLRELAPLYQSELLLVMRERSKRTASFSVQLVA